LVSQSGLLNLSECAVFAYSIGVFEVLRRIRKERGRAGGASGFTPLEIGQDFIFHPKVVLPYGQSS
jgi:hypothetical protein